MFDADDREKLEATCWEGWIWCCRGDASGEVLARDDRSEEDEVTDES